MTAESTFGDLPAESRTGADRGASVTPGLPTGLPWIEIVLPQPPSVNRFMGKLGNRSPIVKAWIKQADMAFVLHRANLCGRSMTKIKGEFEIVVVFERDKSDFHNRLKVLLDWLQRVELIQNDRFCERLVGLWGERGSGCLVKLRPYLVERP